LVSEREGAQKKRYTYQSRGDIGGRGEEGTGGERVQFFFKFYFSRGGKRGKGLGKRPLDEEGEEGSWGEKESSLLIAGWGREKGGSEKTDMFFFRGLKDGEGGGRF